MDVDLRRAAPAGPVRAARGGEAEGVAVLADHPWGGAHRGGGRLLFAAGVGRQTPFLALIIPFVLVFIVDGRRGLREAWPAALTAGLVFAVVQFAVSNYVNVQLTDILAALASAGAVLALTRVWSPNAPATA